MTPPRNSSATRDIATAMHPYTDARAHEANGPMIITRGEGVRVWDDQGRSYIDTVAGLWCAALGFSNERLVAAATAQMRKLPFYHAFTSKSHEPLIDLSEMLVERAPVPMSKAFFCNSGSEANDTAVKMIWYYNNAVGRPQKKKIISRIKGYHGVTVASASLTGLPANHKLFDLPIAGVLHTTTPHYYHEGRPGESEEEFATRCASDLEELILREGPETVAAMFMEPVMGAGGVIVPPKTYYEKIQAVLKKYDVLIVADEVICGFGRTGEYWGCTTFGIEPDILTCAKALSAGMAPISAVLVNDRIFDALLVQSGRVGHFAHSATYCAHPVAAAVANEVLDIYEEIDVVARARELGGYMMELARREAERPVVGDVRGVGLICAIELTGDKAARAPVPDIERATEFIAERGRAHGLLLRAIGPTLAFAPPLNATRDDVDEIFTRFGRVLDDFEAAFPRVR